MGPEGRGPNLALRLSRFGSNWKPASDANQAISLPVVVKDRACMGSLWAGREGASSGDLLCRPLTIKFVFKSDTRVCVCVCVYVCVRACGVCLSVSVCRCLCACLRVWLYYHAYLHVYHKYSIRNSSVLQKPFHPVSATDEPIPLSPFSRHHVGITLSLK